MQPITTEAFAAALDDLDEAEFAAFVAALWAARGWRTRREDGVVVATDGDTSVRLLVDHSGGPDGGSGRFESRESADGPEPAREPSVDAVVTSAVEATALPVDGVDVVDARELRQMALYAVDREDRDRLFSRHLGRPPTEAAESTREDSGGAPFSGLSARALGAVALVAVAMAVGATGLPGPPAPAEPTATATATPVPVPVPDATATATGTPDPRPPGLSERGITNVSAFTTAHLETIRDSSYTYRYVERVEAGGTPVERTAVTVAHNESIDRISIERDGPEVYGATFREIYTGTPILERVDRGNETVYHRLTRHQLGHRREELPAEGVTAHLLGRTVTPRLAERSVENGTVRYHLVATRVARPDRFASIEAVENPRNLSLSLWVDETGVVREYRIAYTARVGDRTLDVTRRVTYSDVGSTTPERPPWYERGFENSTTPDSHH